MMSVLKLYKQSIFDILAFILFQTLCKVHAFQREVCKKIEA